MSDMYTTYQGAGAVTYPTTYSSVRGAGTYGAEVYSSAGVDALQTTYGTTYSTPYQNTVTAVFPSFDSAQQQSRGRGGGKGRRGRGRGGYTGPPKIATCAKKHPIAALKTFRPEASFEMVAAYQTEKGSALVYTTTIDGTVYQGEATTAKIAKAMAATKALAGIGAHQHELVEVVADYHEQKELVLGRIAVWQEAQASKDRRKKDQDAKKVALEQGVVQASKKKKDNKGEAVPAQDALQAGGPVQVTVAEPPRENRDYGVLIQRYGPDIQEMTLEVENRQSAGFFLFNCKLTVQGFKFEGEGGSKKRARNVAVEQAFRAFEENPPPVVNEKRPRLEPNPKRSKAEFKVIEPVEFQDKLAEKCWNFVTEKTADLPTSFKHRRNLVVIVKVEGEESLENCEIVTFGCGSLLIKKENMTSDGTVIKDCTGESLALRALRRYLLDQIELCLRGKHSIYNKDKGGKCAIKNTVSFCLYTNSSPMGDCRAVYVPPPPEVEEPPVKIESDATTNPAAATIGPIQPNKFQQRRYRYSTAVEDLGKITFAKKDLIEGSSEGSIVYDEEKCHCIISPSDKLAIRQMCGIQGSILFNLCNPIHISQYLVNRSFDEQTLTRALWSRIKGATIRGPAGLEPQLRCVEWKITRVPEKRSVWALIWAKNHELEILLTTEGKRVDGSLDGTVQIDAKHVKEQNMLKESDYCTRTLFIAVSDVCRKNKKPNAQKYSAIKYANNRYKSVKTAVINHLKDTGMGSWSENPCKPNY